MSLELISFKICPFVQRAAITLNYKNIPHTITYIDLDNPPDWFLKISPFGKVPLLRVDGETVLFESAVINEYLDEITPNPLMPNDPLVRAVNRAWIEFSSACLVDHFMLVGAVNEGDFAKHNQSLTDKLQRMEDKLISSPGPYFNGTDLALVDTAFAPLFMRLALLRPLVVFFDTTSHPCLSTWSSALLALPAVKKSVPDDFPTLYQNYLRRRGGHLASRLT